MHLHLCPLVFSRLLFFVGVGSAIPPFMYAGGVAAAPVELVEQRPISVTSIGDAVWLIDFGKVAFGNLALKWSPVLSGTKWRVYFGEAATPEGGVNRKPPGTVRYAEVEVTVSSKGDWQIMAPAADERNTAGQRGFTPPAILTPGAWGVILPFRWVELERIETPSSGPIFSGEGEGQSAEFEIVRRAAFDATWDDAVAHFESSDELLNRIWELSHYSIKATTYAGVFVDGDRERIPYEADAYLNQLSYYACNPDPRMSRATFEYLIVHPTWPTEWAPHMIFIAHADWWHTGDREWLAQNWEALKAKLQLDRIGADGLLTSTPEQIERGDIVDWPAGERDGYVFTSINTVVNAFHLRALALMSELANVLGHEGEAQGYRARLAHVHGVFLERLFDKRLGLFCDGVGTKHVSLHANLFPLAFGLVEKSGEAPEMGAVLPSLREQKIAQWLIGRGMRCSPYAAQYLMEALFLYGDPDAALGLMVAEGDRSWKHMVNSGTTITWEAWAQHYKPNQDWNHAWGAAPANLLPRFVLGVTAAEPGWAQVRIRPFSGGALSHAKGRVPTPRGGVVLEWQRSPSSQLGFYLNLSLPEDVNAWVEVPVTSDHEAVWINGVQVEVRRVGNYWQLLQPVSGEVIVSTQPF